ncbi:glyoxylase-like metal-dependent hydrolase (beta-lactamase superfamily II) [Bradyrhizobium sp. GM24.11]
MDQQDAVDRGVGKRQRELVDQRGQRGPPRGPFQHALRRRHEGDTAFRILAEQPQIGRGIADAEHTLALGIRPALPNAAIDHLPCHDAEAPGIKLAKVDDVDGHDGNVTCTRRRLRAEYCIACATLTPYLSDGAEPDGDIMAAEIRTFTCLNDNFGYLIHDVETKATASIDAPEAGPIIKALEREGWQLTDILITHHHGDHVGGVAELKQKYNCRVVAPHDKTTKIADVDLRVANADVVKVGTLLGRVLETPGHTLDHISYVFDTEKTLFAADTAVLDRLRPRVRGHLPDDVGLAVEAAGPARRLQALLRPRIHGVQRQVRADRRSRQRGSPGTRGGSDEAAGGEQADHSLTAW